MKFHEVVLILIFFVISVSCSDNSTGIFNNEHCYQCKTDRNKDNSQACLLKRCDCSNSPKLKFTANLYNQEEEITERTKLSPSSKKYLPPPVPHCIETSFIVLHWNTSSTPGILYYIQYYTDFPENRSILLSHVTQCGYMTLYDLKPDTVYAIKLVAVKISDGLFSKREYSSCIKLRTRKENLTPRPVDKFWMDKQIHQNHSYTISLKWKKARDRSCFYKLTYFSNDEGDYNEIDVKPLINDEWNITNLQFGTYYPISITAYTSPNEFPTLESSKKWVNITTPTCLETFNQIEKCIPDKPRNLKIEEYPSNVKNNKSYFITMEWEKPEYVPTYYTIVIKLWDSDTILFYNITGNSTSFTVSDIQLTPDYDVLLIAHSGRRASAPAAIHRQLLSNVTTVDVTNPTATIKYILIIGGPIILICLVVLFGLKFYLTIRPTNPERVEDTETKCSIVNNLNAGTIIKFQIDKWEIDANKIVIKEILGCGAFGVVHKGLYCRGKEGKIEVAIKMLKENPTSEEIQQFQQEIQLMKSVPIHPHLVSLIGCVTKERLLLVVEYCPKGDLQSFLRTASDKILKANLLSQGNDYVEKSVFNKMYEFDQLDLRNIPETKDLISFARQISLGMEYLSSLKLIHRDLAARNVLITDNNIAKISDFGLSRDVYYNNMYCKSTGGKLPIRWMALESITHQMYTTQSDVWSFGILLWEIITMGGTPYPGIPTHDIMGMLKFGYRMKKPENCSDELYYLMCKCWNEQPNSRPSFTEIRESLDELLVIFSNYVNLDKKTDYREQGVTIENKKQLE